MNEIVSGILSKLNKVSGPDKNGWYTALCPFHDDQHHPNLRLSETNWLRVLWAKAPNCRTPGDFDIALKGAKFCRSRASKTAIHGGLSLLLMVCGEATRLRRLRTALLLRPLGS